MAFRTKSVLFCNKILNNFVLLLTASQRKSKNWKFRFVFRQSKVSSVLIDKKPVIDECKRSGWYYVKYNEDVSWYGEYNIF